MNLFKKSIFSNSAWMISEKFVNIFGLFFVNSYMAKYIGPDDFGKITFANSLFIFIQTFAWLGAQNVLFKRMSENKKSGLNLALSTQVQRRSVFFITSLLVLSYLHVYADFITFIFGLASSVATYYIISDIFSIYNNSQLNSQINTLTNVIGLIVTFLTRYLITWFHLPIYWFAIPIVLLAAIPYGLRWLYLKRNCNTLLLSKRRQIKYKKYLFYTGGSLLLSTLSIAIYTQISNLFLARLISYQELGVYTVALTIGGAWSFVSQALISSFFSKIYEQRDSLKIRVLLQQINRITLAVAILVFIGFEFLGEWFIKSLYGVEYLQAVKLIPLIILATTFSSMGTICYRYIIKEGGYRYLTIKMLIIAGLSIPCSYLFINYFKSTGAAYCFFLIEFFSCTLANYFFKKGFLFHVHKEIIGI
ncbi:oligosaccharide flippase family protein [Paramixta manurensis]|uniref:Oligosaccharide flippase family protein n=1 Tax=Paramixta manurensis TaxID=2740817 RepID=A0A6M8UF50_9GAMM|nr:oligosaccharide flippase family protein [Erwiniaceae bacterium PD-1]